jgi:hypothetical protein
MTSFRQIGANRRNASKSTGPATVKGKQRARCNSLRHGLTAETVICGLEDVEDYKAFETAITADFDVHSAIERELVLRLASLLWRLRRATSIETGLFEIQSDHATDGELPQDSADLQIGCAVIEQSSAQNESSMSPATVETPTVPSCHPRSADLIREIACRFLHLQNFALDRLHRYEVALWRQVAQTLFTLDALDRRKPQERVHRSPTNCQRAPHIQRHDEP